MDHGNLSVVGKLSAGVDQKIYETTLSGAATSITISGLDGNTDLIYYLVCHFIAGADTTVLNFRINNDTGTNYGFQQMYGQNSTVSASQNTAWDTIFLNYGALTGKLSLSKSIIFAKTGKGRVVLTEVNRDLSGATIDLVQYVGAVWNNTATNITSLVIYSDQPNGIGIGSHITLYARRATG